jgi:peptide/nickel transport system permease protein
LIYLIGSRLVQALFVLFGTTLIVFMLINLAGGDIALNLLPDTASPQVVEAYKVKLGLDQPPVIQYATWLGGVVTGNFGNSFLTNTPAMSMVLDRLPATVQLATAALLIALAVALPLGILAAVKRGSIWDRASMALALAGQSIANFWLGLMLILFFAVFLRVLPVSGRDEPLSLVLPAIALATGPMAQFSRLIRSGMLEILNEDYVRTAHAKGLSERAVVNKHALRNALLPFITIVGLEFGTLLNGSVVIETVFAWPGIGYLLVGSLGARDLPVIEAGVLLVAVIYVGLNLIVDILYTVIDPRVRYR